MPVLTRRRLLIAISMVVIFLVGVAVFALSRYQDLRSRSAQILVGMPRDQVEEILGPPVLELPRPSKGNRFGGGAALSWVDQFWQVDVLTGPDGRVESVDYMPSDSFYRRTIGRLTSFPK